MANKNANPVGGKNADSGVINTPQPSRARTHARVVRPTGILKESLLDLSGARARVREDGTPRSEAALAEWRTKTFGGDFDPVRESVEDAVNAFSYRQPEIAILISDRLKHLPFRLINLSSLSKIQARYKSFPIVAKAEEAFVQVKERKKFLLL